MPQRLPTLKVFILLSALLCVSALLAGLWWAQQFLKPVVSLAVVKAENALFDGGSIAVAHINVEKITELDALSGANALDISQYDSDIFKQLNDSALTPRDGLEHIVVGASTDGEPLIAALGRFKASAVEAFIQRYYEAEQKKHKGVNYWLVTQQDRYSCEYAQERAIIVKDGEVFWGNPLSVVDFYLAYQNAATTSNDANWATYRGTRLISVALMSPANVEQLNPGGFAGMLMSKTKDNIINAQALYMGITVEVLPIQARLDIQMHSHDKEWVELIHAAASMGLKELKTNLAQEPESKMAQLISGGITVEAQERVLYGEMVLGLPFFETLSTTFDEGLGALFTMGSGSRAKDTDAPAVSDKIDDNAKPYPTALDINDLPAFKDTYNQGYDFIEGAFAGRLSAFEIGKSGQKELHIEIASSQLTKDFPRYKPSLGTLTITGVFDSAGNNILRTETCGRELNSEPVKVTEMNGALSARKVVRLTQGKDITDVADIEYALDVNVPTQFVRQVINVNNNEQIITYEDMTLTLSAGPGNLDHASAGNTARLASIRPMNTSEQYLSTGGSWGFNGKTSVSVSGTPTKIEAIFTTAYKTIQQQKRSHLVKPKDSDSHFAQPNYAPAVFTPTAITRITNAQPDVSIFDLYKINRWKDKPQFKMASAPIAIAAYEAKVSSFGADVNFEADVAVLTPIMANADKLNLCRIHTTHIEVTTVGPITLDNITACKLDKIDVWGSDLTPPPYLAANPAIKVKLPLTRKELPNDAQVLQVSGSVILTLATAVQPWQKKLPKVGAPFLLGKLEGVLVQMKRSSAKFYFKGDASTLHSAKILDDKGKVLTDSYTLRSANVFDSHGIWHEEAYTVLEFGHFSGRPVDIEFNLVQSAQVIKKPFTLVFDTQNNKNQ